MPHITKMEYIIDGYGDDKAVIESLVCNKETIDESDMVFKCRGVKNGKGYFDAVIRDKDGVMIEDIESASFTSIEDACRTAIDYATVRIAEREKSFSILNPRLIAVVKYAKTTQDDLSVYGLKEALAPIYCAPEHMAYVDLIEHILAVYYEMVAEQQFGLGQGKDISEHMVALVTAPAMILTDGMLETKINLRDWYDNFIINILSRIRSSAKVGWCCDELGLKHV
jgi:hypothetical protein